jgi:crossover junction endodeoxyribonuclease RusA
VVSSYSFVVPGAPTPQGSTRAFLVKGKPIITNKSPGLVEYRSRVALAAQNCEQEPIEGPVDVSLRFYLARPKSRPKKFILPDRRPDLDKLVRAVFDGLTDVCFADDAQVVRLSAVKLYGKPCTEIWVGPFEYDEDEPVAVSLTSKAWSRIRWGLEG